MLDIHRIREEPEDVAEALERRAPGLGVQDILDLDKDRRTILGEVEALKKHRNEASKNIGSILKSGGDAGPLREEMRQVGESISGLEARLQEVEASLRDQLLQIPNLPHESVPVGESEADNVVVRTQGEPTKLDFEPRAHWDIGEDLGILDFERSAKLAGARFAVLSGDGALLERALIQFMLDLHTREHGYTEILPPFLVNADALIGTGQLPKFEERSVPHRARSIYFLIPTAEVPVTNIHRRRDSRLRRTLPLAVTRPTPPASASEAGSHGRDVPEA